MSYKLTDLSTFNTPASGDYLPLVDVSDTTQAATGTTKIMTYANFVAGILSELGVTASVAELNFVDGVTSDIQTQIDTKASTASPVFSGSVDLNGIELIMDADADTSLTADTDDQVDMKVAGNDRHRWTDPDYDLLGTNPNILVGGADPNRIIELPASSWTPTTTSGCADIATVEAATNDIDYKVLDFDASSDENAFLNFQMPTSYDGGVIQFRYVWTNAGGGSAETVVFELSGRAYTNDDAIDQAVGTPVEVSDTWIAQNDIHISDWSSDVTLAGSPAGGQWVHFEIMRDVSEDNLTGDARLIGVQIRYKQAQYSE